VPSVTDAYRLAFRPPLEVPAALFSDALLMTAISFLLPPPQALRQRVRRHDRLATYLLGPDAG
jgi:hypothetical protein